MQHAAPAPNTSISYQTHSILSHEKHLSTVQPKAAIRQGRTLQQLVEDVGGVDERLDPEVETLLLELADDFVENVASFACVLAKHRHSTTLDVQDLALHLEKQWQMRIPGFTLADSAPGAATPMAGSGGASGAPASNLGAASGLQVRTARKATLHGVGEAHRKRLALVQKLRSKENKQKAAAAAAATQAATTGAGGAGAPATAAAAGTAAAADTKGAAAAAAAKKRKRGPDDA